MLADIIHLLDKEFIYDRGRTIGLVERFPDLFLNKENIHTKEVNGKTASIVITDKIEYLLDGILLNCLLIGFVFTDEKYRGKGLARELLLDIIKSTDCDVILLWAKNHKLYSEIGFVECDFYQNLITIDDNLHSTYKYELKELELGELNTIKNISKSGVLVKKEHISRLQPFIDKNYIIFDNNTYILFGKKDNTITTLDFCGEDGHLLNMITQLYCSFDKVFINDINGIIENILNNKNIKYSQHNKKLAMYFADKIKGSNINIPHFYRI